MNKIRQTLINIYFLQNSSLYYETSHELPSQYCKNPPWALTSVTEGQQVLVHPLCLLLNAELNLKS